MTTYNPLVSADRVTDKINQLAAAIINDHSNTNPLFVALLRGANPFAGRLMLAIAKQSPDFHPEMDYMMVRTYGTGTKAHTPEIITDIAPSTSITGRTIIIIDDVLDKGITAAFVRNHLLKNGASTVQLAVLAEKNATKVEAIEADYTGFSCGDKWLVGMGMDDAASGNEHYRWLDEIWEINQP